MCMVPARHGRVAPRLISWGVSPPPVSLNTPHPPNCPRADPGDVPTQGQFLRPLGALSHLLQRPSPNPPPHSPNRWKHHHAGLCQRWMSRGRRRRVRRLGRSRAAPAHSRHLDSPASCRSPQGSALAPVAAAIARALRARYHKRAAAHRGSTAPNPHQTPRRQGTSFGHSGRLNPRGESHTGSGDRTRTPQRARDFKSLASTNSAIPARRGIVNHSSLDDKTIVA